MPEKLKKDAEMYAGSVSGASRMSEYLNIIENSGFTDLNVHKQKEISLPESVLSKYYDESALNSIPERENGIFSITVSASRPR